MIIFQYNNNNEVSFLNSLVYIKNENAVIFQTLHYAKIAFSYIKFICARTVRMYLFMYGN